MQIHTQRLLIRPYSPNDLSDLHEIFSDPVVMRYCEPPYTLEQTQRILDHFLEQNIAYAAVLADSGKVIGHILFHQLPAEADGIFEIGWVFNRSYWGQGFAYEACQATVNYGFHVMGLHKICAETIDPTVSCGLMRKLGMQNEGTFCAHAMYLNGHWTDVYWYGICNPMEGSYESIIN